MRLEQLRYLLYVAECGSINSAGKKYFISPQAIHAALNKLEDSVGVMLLERTGKGVSFTNAGLIMLKFAQRTLSEYKQVMQAITALDQDETKDFERLVIYAPLMFENYLNKKLSKFIEMFPDILISVFFDRSSSIVSKIDRYEDHDIIDAGDNIAGVIAVDIETYETTKNTFDHGFLGNGCLYYCVRKDSDLAKEKRPNINKVLRAPLIVLRSTDAALDIATMSTLSKYTKPNIQGYAASLKIFANFIYQYDCVGVYADFSQPDKRLIDITKFNGLQLLNCENTDDRVFIYRTSKGCSSVAKTAVDKLFELF